MIENYILNVLMGLGQMNELGILNGRICKYCMAITDFVDSAEVYSRSYGMIYLCRPCNAYVGVHKNSNKAKGSVANHWCRELRKAAHQLFDDKWKSGAMTRTQAYKWLSGKLNIPLNECHIGMFEPDKCREVIELCKN